MRKSSRGNPYHDERGRFASADSRKFDGKNYYVREQAEKNGDYNRKDANDLRQLTKRALERGGKQNNWNIQRGGYDLWYEAYYKGEPAFRVIDGKIECHKEKYRAYAEDFAQASSYKIACPTYRSIKLASSKLATEDYDDGTYDAETLEPIEYESGYQVAYCQIGDDYTEEEHENLIREFLSQTDDNKVALGKFESTPEHSFHFPSRKKAIEFAQKYNQISIWDWKAGNKDWRKGEIKIGGTGRKK